MSSCLSPQFKYMILHIFTCTITHVVLVNTSLVNIELLYEGGIGIYGFAVLDIFLIGFSVFVSKDFGFSVQCGLRIFRFLGSGFRFS